jgi:hypothetical protein
MASSWALEAFRSTWLHVAWIETSVNLVSYHRPVIIYDGVATTVVFAAVESVWLDVRILPKTVHPRKPQFLYCIALRLQQKPPIHH